MNMPEAAVDEDDLAAAARNHVRAAGKVATVRLDLEPKAAGWSVLVLWECQMKDARRLEARVRRFMRI